MTASTTAKPSTSAKDSATEGRRVNAPARRGRAGLLATLTIALSTVGPLAAIPFAVSTAQAQVLHDESGVTVPQRIGEFALVGINDRVYKFANIYQFRNSKNNDENLTIYISKLVYPNAMLWFEGTRQSIFAMKEEYPNIRQVFPERTFAFASPRGANGVSAVFEANGKPDTLGIAVAVWERWLVSIHRSSKSVGAAELDKEMSTIWQALTAPPATAAPNPLLAPAQCADQPGSDAPMGIGGMLQTEFKLAELQKIAPTLIATDRQFIGQTESVATTPKNYCRVKLSEKLEGFASVYRPISSTDKSWSMLFFYTGIAFAAVPVPALVSAERRAPYIFVLGIMGRSNLWSLSSDPLDDMEAGAIGLAMYLAEISDEALKTNRGPASVDNGSDTVLYHLRERRAPLVTLP